jgi:hypothetical protein
VGVFAPAKFEEMPNKHTLSRGALGAASKRYGDRLFHHCAGQHSVTNVRHERWIPGKFFLNDFNISSDIASEFEMSCLHAVGVVCEHSVT